MRRILLPTILLLLAIGFWVSAGMIALGAGIGIIMGAHLGTTTGAWLIAGFGLRVDLAAWTLPRGPCPSWCSA